MSKSWRLAKCLIRRNICCSSKTRRRCARPSPSSWPTAAIVVEQAESGEAALAELAEFAFDIIVTDLRLPGIDGSARRSKPRVDRYPDIIAIVVTGYGTVKDAVEAIKRGAWDFVSKPFQIDELLHVLDSALEQRRLKSENAYLRAQLEERYRFEGIVGKSRAMTRLFQLLETVARDQQHDSRSPARPAPARKSSRARSTTTARAATHRFVALNCSAIPETLLEAELFGHVRGAFTGAVGNRQGRLEQAHKGTLFLDEVGTMSAALQMKLLRVLQEREFERVGDSHTIKVDVRVIAATNSDLAQMVADGQFREDLFYRLNVIPVQLPPLRERKEDIPLLVQHFLEKFRNGGAAASDGVAGGDAAADGVCVAGQRPAARECDRTGGGVRRPRGQIEVADLPPEIAGAEPHAVERLARAAGRRHGSRRIRRQHRTRADPAVARADRRQQGAGRPAAEPEAHDAGREAQTIDNAIN